MRLKPRVDWVLVAASAGIAVLTIFFVGGFASGYGPTTGQWLDGAWFALANGTFGLVVTIVPAVLAIILGSGAWVRVAASAIILGAVIGLAAAGGMAAQGRYASAAKAPDCTEQGMAVDPEIQSAFDELEHPGWIDTLAMSTTGCAAVVRNLSPQEVSDAYRDQLDQTGWTIEQTATLLVATRNGYRFTVSDCGEAWIAIEAEGADWTYC